MDSYLKTHLQIALQLLILAVAIIAGAGVAHFNQRMVVQSIIADTKKIEEKMLSLAEITDRNGADEEVSKIIIDCPRRSEYESMLNSLSTLTRKDLLITQGLFESCGSFYSERKALMVSKLDRELQAYSQLNELLKSLGSDELLPNTKIWTDIVTLEKDRSTLLSDQKQIQEKIISLLISGSSVTSKEVASLIQEAREISELLSVDDNRIDTLREEIKK